MKFLYQYPEMTGSDGDLLDAGEVGEVAKAVEAAGFSGFAFTEHPIPGSNWLEAGGHQTLDPFVALSYAAAVTERIKLLTFLAVVPYRNPFLLAKSAATVDKLSNGRFILGVGTGYLKSEFHALGVDFEERNALFDEALDVLPLHWKGEVFNYTGKHFQARGVIARPRPVQDPIPIWIGGNAKITLRRVAERAQGWMPLVGPPELSGTARTPHLATLDDISAKIKDLKEAAGDRAAGLDVAMAYTDPTIGQPLVDVERHKEFIAKAEEIGVTWLVLAGMTAKPSETLDFVQGFGATYITS
ncbi:MAG: putative Alkanesulfonate monooxygenase (FMNH2-dependent aliphatic sulfonate monooxygenase 1) [Acidimicrobiia bacterium]|nr:putative Alkanesulfonate monooxygenase (FMNH2-dependent aliphatic sulfonate monooxygenase 1) [Acidimicrobiia bacterium]